MSRKWVYWPQTSQTCRKSVARAVKWSYWSYLKGVLVRQIKVDHDDIDKCSVFRCPLTFKLRNIPVFELSLAKCPKNWFTGRKLEILVVIWSNLKVVQSCQTNKFKK